jgi:prephenate dehydrogenase
MGFEQISILGVGLMGGSVGLACRSLGSDYKITGYSHRSDELKRALERGAIDRATDDAAAAVAEADLVILCTPVGLFGDLLCSIASSLKPQAIVTDVGSTKRSIVRQAGEILPITARFVGSHPMVGGEKHGIEHARADLLSGSLCIVTPEEMTDPNAADQVERFWQSLRMRTVQMSPETHDQLTADISHLPHVIAAALVRIQSPESLKLAGRGFLDTTRIAAGDPALWRDILLENRDHLRSGLECIQFEIKDLLAKLDAGDAKAVQEWLSAASQRRNAVPVRSLGTPGEGSPGKLI